MLFKTIYLGKMYHGSFTELYDPYGHQCLVYNRSSTIFDTLINVCIMYMEPKKTKLIVRRLTRRCLRDCTYTARGT